MEKSGIEANGLNYPLGRAIVGNSKLKRAIEIWEKKRKIEDKKIENDERRLRNDQRKFLKDRLDLKLKLSKEIFDWSRRFAKSDEYRKLNYEDDDEENDEEPKLEIYHAEPTGHLPPEQKISTEFSDLYLCKDGSLDYVCWASAIVPGSIPGSKTFRNPKSLANGLGYDYIFKLHKYLISGKFEEDEIERLSSWESAEDYAKRVFG